ELRQRSRGDVERKAIAKRDHRAMSLIDHARAAFLFAESGDDTLVWSDAVAVRFRRVGRLGQGVADGRVHARVTAITQLRLQSVVIGDAEIHQHVYLAHAAIDRQDWTREIG